MSNQFLISIDLGGTKILSALIDSNSQIVYRYKIPTMMGKGKNGLVSSIAESVRKILSDNHLYEHDVRAVCLGVPGTVNPYSGIIGNAPNLGIKNFNIKEALAKYISIPILIENDVNIAGLGIKKNEFKDAVKNMLVVAIGTGIGGALFFDGKIYRGSSFYAGEIGHMLVEPKGKLSSNSKSASFESTASRTAIVKDILTDIRKGEKSILSDLKSQNKTIKSKNLLLAIKKRDTVAIKHVTKAGKSIGTILGSVTTLLNLDTIVLCGGVIEAIGNYMMPIINKSFKKAVLEEPGKNVKVIRTKLGDDAALYGGIALAEEFLRS
jgi:glucokinase